MSSEPVPRAPGHIHLSSVPGGTTTKARGYADGYAHGWAAGARAAAEQAAREDRERAAREEAARLALAGRVDHALDTLAAAAVAASRRVVPVIEESRDLLVAGAVEIAEAVLDAELSDRGLAVRTALGRALALDSQDRVVRVRLNPGDLAALRETADAVVGTVNIPDGVDLVADPELGPGDAVSELPEGMYDARVRQAVDRVRQELGLSSSPPGAERR